MCVIGILAGIAYPSYQSQLCKIRRSDGQQKLLQLASELEDNYLKNHTYIINSNHNITSDYYDFNIILLSENTYRLTATPKTDQAQKDDPCGVLSITDRQIMGPRAECWG
jgi:type IV pilus assembly protein PilE